MTESQLRDVYRTAQRHHEAGRRDEAAALYRRILQHSPGHPDTLHLLGLLLHQQDDHQQGLELITEAIRRKPRKAPFHNNLGLVLGALERYDEAETAYRQALLLRPHYAGAHYNLGGLLHDQRRFEEALACYRQALGIQPDYVEAQRGLGTTLDEQGKLAEAEAALSAVLRQHPHHAHAAQTLCTLSMVRMKRADWTDYDARRHHLFEQVAAHLEKAEALPLPPLMLNVFDAPGLLRAAVARHRAQHIRRKVAPAKARSAFVYTRKQPERLRIGYVSPDFRRHAVGLLVHRLFEHHDRDAFEVYAYALTGDDDAYTRRIRAGCDGFAELSKLSAEQAARRIHADGIHILIDLGGYTYNTRTDLFALEPAPVQAHWLGYLDTMGAPFLPYIIADPTVIPESMTGSFSEAVVYLPECFAPFSPLEIAEAPPTRADCGLPEEGFVFCCFNALHKIEPGVFEVWMRILRRVPGSVFWLYGGKTEAGREHLRREAEARGVDPARLVFAPIRPMPEYLAQHRRADLFLDTFVYNAGTTAVCALWSGLPVLTKPGATYLSRMGGSLAAAAGLPEMVCDSAETYEARAVHLAKHPGELAALRRKLVAQRATTPLFDTARHARHLERAYRMLWQDYVNGVTPRSLHVPPVDAGSSGVAS